MIIPKAHGSIDELEFTVGWECPACRFYNYNTLYFSAQDDVGEILSGLDVWQMDSKCDNCNNILVIRLNDDGEESES